MNYLQKEYSLVQVVEEMRIWKCQNVKNIQLLNLQP